MNSKVNVLLGLVAVLALYLSSGVEARHLAETSKAQTNVKETTKAETNRGVSYGVISPGRGPVIPCPRGRRYGSCLPPPPAASCDPYKRSNPCAPPHAGEVTEAKPQNQN